MEVIDIVQLGDMIYEYRQDGFVYCRIIPYDKWYLWSPDKVEIRDWPKVKQAIYDE